MDFLVTYDVSTEEQAGRRRLRNVAKLCESYGQRVQKSVFEVQVSRAQYEEMIDALTGVLDEDEDSLRAYRLAQPRSESVECWGRDPRIDLEDDTLIF
jgi:CRISPR-associated protein Cas2